MDVLSDIVNLLRTKGQLYGRLEFGGRWGFEFPGEKGICLMVTRGSCFLGVDGQAPLVPLAGGDFVLLAALFLPTGAFSFLGVLVLVAAAFGLPLLLTLEALSFSFSFLGAADLAAGTFLAVPADALVTTWACEPGAEAFFSFMIGSKTPKRLVDPKSAG